MSKVNLTGYIDVPEHRLAEVQAHLPDHIRLTLAEAGCVSFSVTKDTKVAGRFNVAEEFTDRAAFDAHQARTKASEWAKVTAGIPRQYEITESER